MARLKLTAIDFDRPLAHDLPAQFSTGFPAGWDGSVDESTGVLVVRVKNKRTYRMHISRVANYSVSSAKADE